MIRNYFKLQGKILVRITEELGFHKILILLYWNEKKASYNCCTPSEK